MAATGSLSVVGYIRVSIMLLLGIWMHGYANETLDVFFVALFLLIVGFLLVNIVFPCKGPELRAFLLTFAICIFVGGLAQCYSFFVFGDTQSTRDAFTFLHEISASPPFTTFSDITPNFNSPLAVMVWQQAYKLTWLVGFDFGPYTAIMFNAFVMGLTASITVRTAREIFGHDIWRLERVGTLFALCGLFILFGSVMIRDCFTTLLNAAVLFGIVRWLCRPKGQSLIIASAITGISVYAMSYLRIQAVALFGLYWALAILAWYLSIRLNYMRSVIVFFIACALVLSSSYVFNYTEAVLDIQSEGLTSYAEHSTNTHVDESLGVRLVVAQPLPIRLIMGSGLMMINPIPLWGYFKIGARDIHWIKGYHGLYQVLMLPLVFAGLKSVYRMFQNKQPHHVPLLFLSVYLIINLMAVVATSMEQRHLGQFMSAFIIMGALPDVRGKKTKSEIHNITMWWLVSVIIVHLLWFLLKRML